MATEVGISPGGNGRGLGSNAGNGGVGIGATGGSVGSTVGHGSEIVSGNKICQKHKNIRR